MKLVDCSLGPLVNKVKDVQVETIVDTLCSNMLSEKEQLRDISSIGELSSTRTAVFYLFWIVDLSGHLKYWNHGQLFNFT